MHLNPITRDVVLDLLPAYFSGEASADSRALVESYLANHPEFAVEVRRTWMDNLGRVGELPLVLRPATELATLGYTTRLLRARMWLLALAVLFTVMPVAYVRQWPLAAVTWLCAAGAWIAFSTVRRMLAVTRL